MKRRIVFVFAILVIVVFAVAQAEAADRPNILFCIADDASYPHMGAYGCSWVTTPGFDRVAREGILFNNTYTPNAKCAPSRACIVTGRNTWQLEEACNHVPFFPTKFKSYVEVLGANGYFVGKTGKGWAPGIALDADGRRRELVGQPFGKRRVRPPATGISPNDYAANFQDFLDATPNGQPWCFWYGGFEPHRRYEYGSGVAKGAKQLASLDDEVFRFWPDNEVVRNDLLDYAYEIEHFDRHLVRMLDMLEARDKLRNTLVVVTADNGMPFPRIKGQEYEFSNHLPLAIMWQAGIKAPGRVVKDYVSFIDFAPTFVEVAGLDWDRTGLKPSPGKSLLALFRSSKSGSTGLVRDHVLFGKERHDVGRPNDAGYPIRGIVKDNLLYLRNFEPNRWPAGNPETGYLNCDGSPTKTEILDRRTVDGQGHYWKQAFGKRPGEELYDLSTDRQCMTNLAGNPKYQTAKTALRRQLVDELTQQEDPRILGRGEVFDNYIYAHESTRDFYRRYTSGEKVKAGWVNPSDFEEEPLD